MSRVLKPLLVAMGRRMQARREMLRWSQQDVIPKLEQEGIEMTRAAYSHWETGRADIPSSALATIATILEVPVNYLLGQQSEIEWLDEQAMLFYNGTSPDLKPTAVATLRAFFEASDRSQTTHGRKARDTRRIGAGMQARHEVAARLLEVIIERAGGKMPETLLEWRAVARRLGVEQIKFVSPEVLPSPLLRDGVMWLPRVRHRYCLMMRYLVHETAEAGLEWEGEPPLVYPTNGWSNDRHRIAVLIENLAVASAKIR